MSLNDSLLLTVPKRRGDTMPRGAHREASGLVGRQSRWGDVGRKLYGGLHGEEQVKQGEQLRTGYRE